MIILDGGMSRELQRLGAPFRQPGWSALALMEAPHFVEQVHAEFAAAGADIITTNSYAIVPFHIGDARFDRCGSELATLAGRLARRGADVRPGTRVAGSLPPIFGSYRPDLFDSTRVAAYLDVLVGGLRPFVDLWLGETLSSIAEAEAVIRAVQGTGLPLWMSFTLRDEADALARPPMLRSGELVADAAAWAAASAVDALLFNCSQPEVMEPAVRVTAAVFQAAGCKTPIGVYANAFEPAEGHDKANENLMDMREDLGPASYGDWADRWAAAGATIIGGCCGIGVSHIHGVAQRLACVAAD
ncbi:homocysteine S-methyltransferase family protein [Acidisoma cladoniae]|jgi:S-methylmethionine-dependent homocysteine/selenocysteine methylase|uniref:homocysteine S-methyltransferase family protein n=1 Tax=Acidisoma cladoniae TaxID=3040935 RepID=UPI0025519979|nr:homocysteine S-methyltransferase family protein [Acidisoma sp. PAMC 29798]